MRILIVEDEAKIAQFLETSMQSEMFATDTAADGNEGLDMALSADYDLIILDHKLPHKTGIQVCTEVRAAGKNTPIIILSAQVDNDLKVKFLNAGADDYMTKPFSLEELTARVRALLRRPQQLLDTILTFDSLTCDSQRHRVTRGDATVRLTPKEFSLLEYFMRNPGIVLSRPLILEHVWDKHADPFSNTIESHILSLRKKIDLPGEIKLIHTVPGRGYVLDDNRHTF